MCFTVLLLRPPILWLKKKKKLVHFPHHPAFMVSHRFVIIECTSGEVMRLVYDRRPRANTRKCLTLTVTVQAFYAHTFTALFLKKNLYQSSSFYIHYFLITKSQTLKTSSTINQSWPKRRFVFLVFFVF